MNHFIRIGWLLPMLFTLGLALPACNRSSDTETTDPPADTQKKGSPASDADHAEEETGTVELSSAQYQTAGIQLGLLQERTLSGLIRVHGSLAVPPQQKVSISTPYGGILISTPLLPGQSVRKGQTLAVLENPEFIRLQQEYLETASQLLFQQQEHERQRVLSQENVGALKNFQQATSQLGVLRARSEGLRQQLALLGIPMSQLASGKITRQVPVRSPIVGMVTEVLVNRGHYVAANDVLFELMGGGALFAELTVFEGDIARVHIGQRVRLSIVGATNGAGAQEYMGRIRRINQETHTDRTVHVYASLENPVAAGQSGLSRPGLSRPGTFLRALIETGSAPQPALPEGAVVQTGTQSQVFVFEEKEQHNGQTHYRFRPVLVQAGVTENGYRSVTFPEPVPKNAQFVLTGAYDLLSAMNNSEEEGGHDH